MFENLSEINIPGLSYIENYIDNDEAIKLLSLIDEKSWLSDLKRRVQHYGYKYDYLSKSIDNKHYLGPLPSWLMKLSEQLHEQGTFAQIPNQVIINEYLPGQGIAPHIDCPSCFGIDICSLSLGSSCIMSFTKDGNKVDSLLKPNSLISLSGDARYLWKHSIASRKTDKFEGVKLFRQRRVSLTFRVVKKSSAA